MPSSTLRLRGCVGALGDTWRGAHRRHLLGEDAALAIFADTFKAPIAPSLRTTLEMQEFVARDLTALGLTRLGPAVVRREYLHRREWSNIRLLTPNTSCRRLGLAPCLAWIPGDLLSMNWWKSGKYCVLALAINGGECSCVQAGTARNARLKNVGHLAVSPIAIGQISYLIGKKPFANTETEAEPLPDPDAAGTGALAGVALGATSLALLAGVALAYLRHLRRRVSRQVAAALREHDKHARQEQDSLLQSLQGVMLMISAAAVQLKESDESYKLLQRALVLAKETIDEGRNRTSLGSNAHQAQWLSVADKLRSLGQRMERRYGAPFEIFERVDLPPSILDAGVYAIIREVLHRAYRHSGVSSVSCTIDAIGQDILIAIRDNGQGVNVDNASDKRRGRPDLQRISERAALLGMEVSMESELGGGTSVTVRVPMSGSAERSSSSQSRE